MMWVLSVGLLLFPEPRAETPQTHQETATGARWKPLSSDFHNLALSDEERVGKRVQEMLSPRLATLTICAKVVVINTRQAQLLRKF